MANTRHHRQHAETPIDANFDQLAFTVNRHLIDHMRRLAVAFDMDFDCVYIWGITAQLNYARNIRVPGPPDEGGITPPVRSIPAPLRDISVVSGRPKETVRRKLLRLRELGKVERNQAGEWWIVEAAVDEATYEFTLETIKRFLQTADDVHRILAQTN